MDSRSPNTRDIGSTRAVEQHPRVCMFGVCFGASSALSPASEGDKYVVYDAQTVKRSEIRDDAGAYTLS